MYKSALKGVSKSSLKCWGFPSFVPNLIFEGFLKELGIRLVVLVVWGFFSLEVGGASNQRHTFKTGSSFPTNWGSFSWKSRAESENSPVVCGKTGERRKYVNDVSEYLENWESTPSESPEIRSFLKDYFRIKNIISFIFCLKFKSLHCT